MDGGGGDRNRGVDSRQLKVEEKKKGERKEKVSRG